MWRRIVCVLRLCDGDCGFRKIFVENFRQQLITLQTVKRNKDTNEGKSFTCTCSA